jgi:hypothetical protein
MPGRAPAKPSAAFMRFCNYAKASSCKQSAFAAIAVQLQASGKLQQKGLASI